MWWIVVGGTVGGILLVGGAIILLRRGSRSTENAKLERANFAAQASIRRGGGASAAALETTTPMFSNQLVQKVRGKVAPAEPIALTHVYEYPNSDIPKPTSDARRVSYFNIETDSGEAFRIPKASMSAGDQFERPAFGGQPSRQQSHQTIDERGRRVLVLGEGAEDEGGEHRPDSTQVLPDDDTEAPIYASPPTQPPVSEDSEEVHEYMNVDGQLRMKLCQHADLDLDDENSANYANRDGTNGTRGRPAPDGYIDVAPDAIDMCTSSDPLAGAGSAAAVVKRGPHGSIEEDYALPTLAKNTDVQPNCTYTLFDTVGQQNPAHVAPPHACRTPPQRQASYLVPVTQNADYLPNYTVGQHKYAESDEQYGEIYAMPGGLDAAAQPSSGIRRTRSSRQCRRAAANEEVFYGVADPPALPEPRRNLPAGSPFLSTEAPRRGGGTDLRPPTRQASALSIAALSIGREDVGGTMWSDDFNRLARLRYFGPVAGLPDDVQCGIEFSEPVGNSDGSDNSGTVCFKCPPNHGVFVSAAMLVRASPLEESASVSGEPMPPTQPPVSEDTEEVHEYMNVDDQLGQHANFDLDNEHECDYANRDGNGTNDTRGRPTPDGYIDVTPDAIDVRTSSDRHEAAAAAAQQAASLPASVTSATGAMQSTSPRRLASQSEL